MDHAQSTTDPRLKKLQKKFSNLKFLRNGSRGVMGIGFTASAAGNILHSYGKGLIANIISIAAPVILFLAFEMLSRVPKREGIHWSWRGLLIVSTGSIAGITAYLSYFHQRDAIFANTGDLAQARLLPIAIDALMIVGSIVLMEISIQIEEMELTMDAIVSGVKMSAKASAPVKEIAKPVSKRDAVIRARHEFPHLSIKDLTDKLGDVSYNYVAAVVSKLDSAVVS